MNLTDALKEAYKKRLARYIEQMLECEGPEHCATGAMGVAHYYLGKPEMKERAEAVIQRTANWFEECPYVRADGTRRSPYTEADFAASKLARVLMTGTEGLSQKTLDMIEDFYLKHDFESWYKSENHMLIFHISRYIAAHFYRDKVFEAYKKTGKELIAEDKKYITEYLTFRGGHAWGEFDSGAYAAIDLAVLFMLYDFADDELKTLARMSADQLLLDMLADCMGPFYCGAHGRIYEGQALDHLGSTLHIYYGLYFGSPYFEAEPKPYGDILPDLALTTYVPSDYVFAVFAEKPAEYENFEAVNLHSITCPTPHRQLPQEKGHISKYTHITPHYAIGGVCFQDDYENPEAAWYAHHQQHEWELTFPYDSEAKIFTHHPGAHGTEGAEHGYWTGDLECCCGTFYSKGNTALAMYDIPSGEEQEINAHVKFELFESVEDGNYIFLKRGDTYASLYMSEGYYHKTDGRYPERELRAKGAKHAVVCVAGTAAEYGSFDAFIKKIKEVPVIFNKEEMYIEYNGIYMDKKTRRVNGEPVSFPFPLYDNPFMYSELGSGVIKVRTSLGDTTLDFNNITITTQRI